VLAVNGVCGDGGFLALSVGLAVEDEFVGGGLESVDGGLGEERVGHETEPFDRFTVARDDGRCFAVAFDDELVDIGGVDGVHRLEGKVVDDEQIDSQQFADLGVVAVVEAGDAEAFEEPVTAFEVTVNRRLMAAWPRAVARKVLPTPTGPMMTALWPPSTKRSEHSSFQVARS
jgi:hypothetical protein